MILSQGFPTLAADLETEVQVLREHSPAPVPLMIIFPGNIDLVPFF
jgi:hypothetical protein